MTRKYPIIWVIGATRSCKTALAENGIAPIGFKPTATGNYFRDRFGQEDTFSRDFVFQLSGFAAQCLAENPDCHLEHLDKFIADAEQPCVIEGERNPVEFAKLYDPKQDMVFLLKRANMDIYDTVIERGIAVIEQIVRWNVNVGITPRASVIKTTFGDTVLKAEYLGVGNEADKVIIEGSIKERKSVGTPEEKYPWINPLIGLVREAIGTYYNMPVRPTTLPDSKQEQMQPNV